MNSKIAISVVIWLISLPLLFLQFLFVMGFIHNGYTQLPTMSLQTPGILSGLVLLFSLIPGLLSWVALFVMTIGWVKGKPVSLYWPIAGSICAVAGLTQLIAPMLLFAAPEIIFAIYLCYWHVRNGKTRGANA
ncbi:MAG TPA: hypothetical protein VMW07_04030 [Gallionella sp.]|nr:hypothetical protein [Gallionella sp.]